MDKSLLTGNQYHNCGVDNSTFASVAKFFSDRLYEIFENCARKIVKRPHPLLISGGCGLNCDWNSKWIESNIFTEVFIPPCTNDSGSALGTAIDAQFAITGMAKISWSIYAGEYPVEDVIAVDEFIEEPYSADAVARYLVDGNVIGWVKGRYELGPRALGARSILASPASKDMLSRLNQLKCREAFRPIAPVCLAEEIKTYFATGRPSPYMLEFRQVTSSSIPAVTHADGSARPQSITGRENPELYSLMRSFHRQCGLAVLCNTSLNFNGRGFINRLSDLKKFSLTHGLDGFFFNNRFFRRRAEETS